MEEGSMEKATGGSFARTTEIRTRTKDDDEDEGELGHDANPGFQPWQVGRATAGFWALYTILRNGGYLESIA